MQYYYKLLKIILNKNGIKELRINIKYKFIFIPSLIFIIFYTQYSFSHNKVCVCAIGKEENKYAREFVEHYKKYGIDKIFIYDNNDSNGENFYGILNDYIKSGFVKII